MTSERPDLAALYRLHGDAMHKVAASVLREAGRADEAGDAVQDAIVSVLASPPGKVANWEAFLVTAAKRRALDRLRSAEVRHAGGEFQLDRDDRSDDEIDVADDVAEALDRKNDAADAWDALAILDERHRKVVWEISGLERPRGAVAADLGVTPGRVSQMLSRGLQQLREEMERRESDRG